MSFMGRIDPVGKVAFRHLLQGTVSMEDVLAVSNRNKTIYPRVWASEETPSAIEIAVYDLHDSVFPVSVFRPPRLGMLVRQQPVVRAEVLPPLQEKVLLWRPRLDWSLGVCHHFKGSSSYGFKGRVVLLSERGACIL